jgi:hypothetical protein
MTDQEEEQTNPGRLAPLLTAGHGSGSSPPAESSDGEETLVDPSQEGLSRDDHPLIEVAEDDLPPPEPLPSARSGTGPHS